MLLIALLLLSTASWADEHCTFEVAPANSGDFVDQLERMSQEGCGTLNKMALGSESFEKTQDHERKTCCKRANKFVRKHSAVCTDEGRLQTKIELIRELCGNIGDEMLAQSANECFTQLSEKVHDTQVQNARADCEAKRNDKANSYDSITVYKHLGYLDEVESDCLDGKLKTRAKELKNLEKLAHPSGDAAACAETRASEETSPAKSEPASDVPVPVVDPARSGF